MKMETIEALRLIARGFERERVTDREAKSAVPTILAAIDEIEVLTALRAAAIQNREIAESLRKCSIAKTVAAERKRCAAQCRDIYSWRG